MNISPQNRSTWTMDSEAQCQAMAVSAVTRHCCRRRPRSSSSLSTADHLRCTTSRRLEEAGSVLVCVFSTGRPPLTGSSAPCRHGVLGIPANHRTGRASFGAIQPTGCAEDKQPYALHSAHDWRSRQPSFGSDFQRVHPTRGDHLHTGAPTPSCDSCEQVWTKRVQRTHSAARRTVHEDRPHDITNDAVQPRGYSQCCQH